MIVPYDALAAAEPDEVGDALWGLGDLPDVFTVPKGFVITFEFMEALEEANPGLGYYMREAWERQGSLGLQEVLLSAKMPSRLEESIRKEYDLLGKPRVRVWSLPTWEGKTLWHLASCIPSVWGEENLMFSLRVAAASGWRPGLSPVLAVEAREERTRVSGAVIPWYPWSGHRGFITVIAGPGGWPPKEDSVGLLPKDSLTAGEAWVYWERKGVCSDGLAATLAHGSLDASDRLIVWEMGRERIRVPVAPRMAPPPFPGDVHVLTEARESFLRGRAVGRGVVVGRVGEEVVVADAWSPELEDSLAGAKALITVEQEALEEVMAAARRGIVGVVGVGRAALDIPEGTTVSVVAGNGSEGALYLGPLEATYFSLDDMPSHGPRVLITLKRALDALYLAPLGDGAVFLGDSPRDALLVAAAWGGEPVLALATPDVSPQNLMPVGEAGKWLPVPPLINAVEPPPEALGVLVDPVALVEAMGGRFGLKTAEGALSMLAGHLKKKGMEMVVLWPGEPPDFLGELGLWGLGVAPEWAFLAKRVLLRGL